MSKVIHLSDLHVGKEDKDYRKWRKVMYYIQEMHPHVPVLITGDITDSGSEFQFEMAREWVGELAVSNPVLMVPGNHDYAFKGMFPFHCAATNFDKWYKYCGDPLGFRYAPDILNMWRPAEPAFEGYGCFQLDDHMMAFYVDSGDPRRRAGCAKGWISPGMCSTLANELPQYVSYTRIVMLHHHPFSHTFYRGLEGWANFMQVLRGNCELLLFGHEHRFGVWQQSYLQNYEDWGIECIVSSHRTLNKVSGTFGVITVIEIDNPGTPHVKFRPVLETVDFS